METHSINKFYVPELTEFHVGFEYEAYEEGYEYEVKLIKEQPEVELQVLSEPVQVVGWVKHSYQLDDFITLIDGEISTYVPEVRVKYLDEQDIKELGWEYVSEYEPDKEYGWTRFKIKTDCEYWLTLYGDSLSIDNNEEYEDLMYYFIGVIKNKSELKRIMKQTRILNETLFF